MALHLRIVNSDDDHFTVYADEPCRIEVSLIPTPAARLDLDQRIIMHAYRGLHLDLEQEPDLTYDGTMADEMQDMESYPPGSDAVGVLQSAIIDGTTATLTFDQTRSLYDRLVRAETKYG